MSFCAYAKHNVNSPSYSTMYVGPNLEDYQPLIDWGIISEQVVGGDGKRVHYAQGKTFGGSSARNQQVYHRCIKFRTSS